jgi:hypothetical protein
MKYLKNFESNVFGGYLNIREEILDLCTELTDNFIRCEVLVAGENAVELEVDLDLNLSQWHRGYRDVTLPDGDYSDCIKFFDVYREKLSFVLSELSTIAKRLEGSGYNVSQITGGSSSRNEYFKILIKKEASVVNILKRRDRTN